MEVRVRHLKASCACGSTEFREPHAAPYGPEELLTCERCGRTPSYRDLLDQIGEEAVRQAKASLDALKRAAQGRGKTL